MESTIHEGDGNDRLAEVEDLIRKLQCGRDIIHRDTTSTRMTVSDLLRASVPAQKKGNILDFQPYKFVEMGGKCFKISQGEATLPKYLDAIFIMMEDDLCPSG